MPKRESFTNNIKKSWPKYSKWTNQVLINSKTNNSTGKFSSLITCNYKKYKKSERSKPKEESNNNLKTKSNQPLKKNHLHENETIYYFYHFNLKYFLTIYFYKYTKIISYKDKYLYLFLIYLTKLSNKLINLSRDNFMRYKYQLYNLSILSIPLNLKSKTTYTFTFLLKNHISI